jgi:hypothetical protein
MNKKIKKLWIKALRSGEFKQGRGFLEKDDKYCALGVLSVLGLVEGYCTHTDENGVGGFDQRKYSLSFNIMKWASIAQDGDRFLNEEEHEVILKYRGKWTSIARLNDEGVCFKKIAKIIDENL